MCEFRGKLWCREWIPAQYALLWNLLTHETTSYYAVPYCFHGLTAVQSPSFKPLWCFNFLCFWFFINIHFFTFSNKAALKMVHDFHEFQLIFIYQTKLFSKWQETWNTFMYDLGSVKGRSFMFDLRQQIAITYSHYIGTYIRIKSQHQGMWLTASNTAP